MTESMTRASSHELDEIDQQLLTLLEQDARLSNQELADALSVSAPTVRKRIQRLQEQGIMELVAVTDLAAAGFDYVAIVGVTIEGRAADEVAGDIAALEAVIGVNLVLGEYDIEVVIVAADQQQLSDLLTRQLAAVPGVSKMAPSLSLDVMKFQSNWVSF